MKDLILSPLGLRAGNKLFPCVIGKNGISKLKREGDGKTPTGKHQIVGILYRPDRIKQPRKWAIPIRPRDTWSDDIKDPNYEAKPIDTKNIFVNGKEKKVSILPLATTSC